MSDVGRGNAWLYLLQAGEFFKVGITSTTVEQRIAQLRTGCPYRINLVCAVQLEEARAAEAELHRRMVPIREHGEWFRLTPKQLTCLILTMGAFVGGQTYEASRGERVIDRPRVDFDGEWLIHFTDSMFAAWIRVNGTEGHQGNE